MSSASRARGLRPTARRGRPGPDLRCDRRRARPRTTAGDRTSDPVPGHPVSRRADRRCARRPGTAPSAVRPVIVLSRDHGVRRRVHPRVRRDPRQTGHSTGYLRPRHRRTGHRCRWDVRPRPRADRFPNDAFPTDPIPDDRSPIHRSPIERLPTGQQRHPTDPRPRRGVPSPCRNPTTPRRDHRSGHRRDRPGRRHADRATNATSRRRRDGPWCEPVSWGGPV